jgi:hypothetical protein
MMRLLNLSKMIRVAQHQKMFWKRQLHSWLMRLQYVVVTASKFLFNQVGRNQIARFEDEILLDNSNQQYTKKR